MRRRRNQKSALLTNQIKEKMSEPIQIPSKLKLQSSNQGSAAGSPLEVARVGIAPTSFTTRRTRTTSVTKKIDEKDLEDGTGMFFWSFRTYFLNEFLKVEGKRRIFSFGFFADKGSWISERK